MDGHVNDERIGHFFLKATKVRPLEKLNGD
jgi:hypothetical protein